MTVASDLLTSGRRVGYLVWLESELFAVTGQWIATTPEPRVKAFLAAASGHFGQQAEMLSTLLPMVADGPRFDDFVVAPTEWHDVERELASQSGTVARLGYVWRVVVPSAVARIEDHVAASSAVAEAAGHRVLHTVLAGLVDDLATAEMLLTDLG